MRAGIIIGNFDLEIEALPNVLVREGRFTDKLDIRVSVKVLPTVGDILAAEKAKPYPAHAPRFRPALFALARRCGLSEEDAVAYATLPPAR